MRIHTKGKGTLTIGNNNSFGYSLAPMLGDGNILIQARTEESQVSIGNGNNFSNNVSIISLSNITIGDDCLIGNNVFIADSDFHRENPAERNLPGKSIPTSIGNNVWIGASSIILKGVSIGDNSIIGALSLVNKSIPPNTLAAGNPAKPIRTIITE